ncbi:unnamed protein product [Tilletia controversa]|nr:unnamed protein product [Tilletia controversa]
MLRLTSIYTLSSRLLPGLDRSRLSFSTTSRSATSRFQDQQAQDDEDLSRRFYLNRVLEEYASKPATPISLRQLIFFGKGLARDKDRILQSAEWVRKELPIRLAHRLRDLQALPFVVMSNPHLESVYRKYFNAFESIRRLPPIRTIEDNDRFVNELRWHLGDHLTVIPSLALGMVESSHLLAPAQLDGFMERMLRSRISRRVLAEQHIALSDSLDDPFHFPESDGKGRGTHIGIIYTHLSPASVVRKAAKLLQDVFRKENPDVERIPPVAMDGNLDCQFSYIPEHLEYIIFELLKNAMRATLQRPVSEWDDPPILVTIVEGPPEEDLVIRISDSGGGIPDALVYSPTQGESAPSMATAPNTSESRQIVPEFTHSSASASSASGPMSRGDSPTSASAVAFETLQAPYRPTLAPVSSQDSPSENLLDVLCSFSNVQRRLEIQAAAARQGLSDQQQRPAATVEQDVGEQGEGDHGLSSFHAHSGLSTVDRLEALKRTRQFKGTVGEQVRKTSSGKPDAEEVYSVRTDTGLGLPMSRVYCEFFGGSLNVRSCIGHSTDVFVRLPKLGTRKAITEVAGTFIYSFFTFCTAFGVIFADGTSKAEPDVAVINMQSAIVCLLSVWLALVICMPSTRGYFHPCFTIIACTAGLSSWAECPAYILAQTLGGFLSSVAAVGVYWDSIRPMWQMYQAGALPPTAIWSSKGLMHIIGHYKPIETPWSSVMITQIPSCFVASMVASASLDSTNPFSAPTLAPMMLASIYAISRFNSAYYADNPSLWLGGRFACAAVSGDFGRCFPVTDTVNALLGPFLGYMLGFVFYFANLGDTRRPPANLIIRQAEEKAYALAQAAQKIACEARAARRKQQDAMRMQGAFAQRQEYERQQQQKGFQMEVKMESSVPAHRRLPIASRGSSPSAPERFAHAESLGFKPPGVSPIGFQPYNREDASRGAVSPAGLAQPPSSDSRFDPAMQGVVYLDNDDPYQASHHDYQRNQSLPSSLVAPGPFVTIHPRSESVSPTPSSQSQQHRSTSTSAMTFHSSGQVLSSAGATAPQESMCQEPQEAICLSCHVPAAPPYYPQRPQNSPDGSGGSCDCVHRSLQRRTTMSPVLE